MSLIIDYLLDGLRTLFMSITGGINWYDAYEPLREVSQFALALMNLYIVIGFFTILNVVTGVLPGGDFRLSAKAGSYTLSRLNVGLESRQSKG